MTLHRLFSTTILVLALTGCAGESKDVAQAIPETASETETNSDVKQEDPKMITVRGIVRYKNLEGGFWALDADDGKKYMPSGLDKTLRIDGMVVEVKGIIEEDVVTFQQYGRTLKIKESKMIDNTNARELNSY